MQELSSIVVVECLVAVHETPGQCPMPLGLKRRRLLGISGLDYSCRRNRVAESIRVRFVPHEFAEKFACRSQPGTLSARTDEPDGMEK